MDQLNYVMTQVAGLGDAQRLYRLRSDALEGCTVERWRGGDALGQHAWTDVDVLATRADIALDALPGTRATLVAQTADGGQWQRSGLIADASCLGSDGGLVRYRLQLVSWTWWLQHARHSRVFQEQSVRAIVDAVLAGHAGIARWRWAEGVDAFLGQRVRSYCVQYRESDLDFLQRVLAEEGLGWRLYADEEAPCGNGMEIFADSVALPEDATSAAAGVRFHRSDATESSDSVQAIGLRRRLASTSISLQSDDYRQVRALVAQSPMEGGGGQSSREDYDAVGAYAFSDSTAGARQARLQAQARESHSRGWQGRVRFAASSPDNGCGCSRPPVRHRLSCCWWPSNMPASTISLPICDEASMTRWAWRRSIRPTLRSGSRPKQPGMATVSTRWIAPCRGARCCRTVVAHG